MAPGPSFAAATSRTRGGAQYARGLSVLVRSTNVTPGAVASASDLAAALCGSPARLQYAALSVLREGGAREVLQNLLSLPAGPGVTLAAVRVALALRSTEEFWRAVDLLCLRAPGAWTLRAACIVAVSAGHKARGARCWKALFERLARLNGDREGVGAEIAAAVVCVLNVGDEKDGMLVLPPVVSWEEEDAALQHDVDAGASAVPSLWQEIAWAKFAQREMIEARMEVCLPPPPGVVGQDDITGLEGDAVDSMGVLKEREYVTVCGVRLRRRTLASGCADLVGDSNEMDIEPASPGTVSMVETEGVQEAMGGVARALGDGVPVLLEGPPGCGKSHLLSHIAEQLSPSVAGIQSRDPRDSGSVVRVQMDSIVGASGDDEFAALIGAVVPLQSGKGFRWRPGPVGEALLNGSWLVLENFGSGSSSQSASAAVSSIVARLAIARPGDEVEAPGRGLPIIVGAGFALFATRTVPTAVDGAPLSDWEPPGRWPCWRLVRMPELRDTDLVSILNERFPSITDCTARVLDVMARMRQELTSTRAMSTGPVRIPNMRDAVKLCTRLVSLRAQPSGDLLTPETAGMETMDVLCSWESEKRRRSELFAHVAKAWSLTTDTVVSISSSYTPSFKVSQEGLSVGRASLAASRSNPMGKGKLALTGYTLRLMEQIARATQHGESVCLSGESGCGKTACVQELALRLGKELVVVNMSRSTDIGDLLGGFRPVDLATSVSTLSRSFEAAFCRVTSREKNERFLRALRSSARSSVHYQRALKLMRGAVNALPNIPPKSPADEAAAWTFICAELSRLEKSTSSGCPRSPKAKYEQDVSEANAPVKKRRRPVSEVGQTHPKISSHDEDEGTGGSPNVSIPSMDFQFSDGALVKAMRNGQWILLDELNLAPKEVLERLVGLIDDHKLALNNATGELVPCAPGFALFAAMNPPNDAGKKPLPMALRARCTEFFVDDCLSKSDLSGLVLRRLFGIRTGPERGRMAEERRIADDVAGFYLACRDLADAGKLSDGNGKKVRYSLRSLSRMTDYAAAVSLQMASEQYGLRRALYEGAQVAFVTPLPRETRVKLDGLCQSHLLGKRVGSDASKRRKSRSAELKDVADCMGHRGGRSAITVAGFPVGFAENLTSKNLDANCTLEDVEDGGFVVTETVQKTLQDVCRVLVVGAPKLPVLLQGPTGAGKTSLVSYIAKRTGRRLLRINNHEHTDLAEYLGGYVTCEDGSLEFREGPIVRAARQGDWIVLDELNLAPVEVLEALNRLLDDNREIRVPETGEVVSAAPGFTIFATQNPAGLYGGRKELSQAFRGRFVDILVDELPDADLMQILVSRTEVPQSFAKQMIAVMRELQLRRRSSQLFLGKGGFVSARDIFRWASRKPRSREELAVEGFFLLGERARNDTERSLVRTVILKHTGVDSKLLSDDVLYTLPQSSSERLPTKADGFLYQLRVSAEDENIALTPLMSRMLTLIGRCIVHSEPVLLVGGTGCGKTTACAVAARALQSKLGSINCHRHTEASDFLGSFRPAGRSESSATESRKVFDWVDGPLVEAMKSGHAFLIDEINMADDAVTERLNSVLENDRTLLLSEKGGAADKEKTAESLNVELVVADEKFKVFATMNPGGDFGKKELSPALRNRFTEIWIPSPESAIEFAPLISARIERALPSVEEANLREALVNTGDSLLSFVSWVYGELSQRATSDPARSSARRITLRDISAWLDFITVMVVSTAVDPLLAFAHGARLVLVDGLSVGSTKADERKAGEVIWRKVLELVPDGLRNAAGLAAFEDIESCRLRASANALHCGLFSIARRIKATESESPDHLNAGFSFDAESSARNCARLVRAVCLNKRPVLLEGPPGSGKSSVVEALARAACITCMRVNLSEHTEMSDLVGGFVPSSEPGAFKFRLGPLVTAMEAGHWILLDELNLASQSVLEGLNGILDHRCALFIPELNKEIVAVDGFRVFGAQNAAHQGGGRRGLPRSFLNRFTRVSVEAPTDIDVERICSSTHPSLEPETVSNMVRTLRLTSKRLGYVSSGMTSESSTMSLRDALRWCDLVDFAGDSDSSPHVDIDSLKHPSPGVYFDAVVLQRMKSEDARKLACAAFRDVFGYEPDISAAPSLRLAENGRMVRIGRSLLDRGSWSSFERVDDNLLVHPNELRALQALSHAVAARWPAVISSGSGPGSDASSASSLIRKLGVLCGHHVRDLGVGGSSDAGDLLGGFVQCDVIREAQLSIRAAVEAVDGIMVFVLFSEKGPTRSNLDVCNHVGRLEDIRRVLKDHLESLTSAERLEDDSLNEYRKIIGLVDDAGKQAGCFDQCASGLPLLLSQKLADAHDLLDRACVLMRTTGGAFEWRKSALVDAAERGDWVLISNADQCPAAVLDRLNPLLERPAVKLSSAKERRALKNSTGCLYLAEAPSDDSGQPIVVRPHPAFRIFLTIDARRGLSGSGLSKAFRNRSLEINLFPSPTLGVVFPSPRLSGFGTAGQLMCSASDSLLSNLVLPGALREELILRALSESRSRACYEESVGMVSVLHCALSYLLRDSNSGLSESLRDVIMKAASHPKADAILPIFSGGLSIPAQSISLGRSSTYASADISMLRACSNADLEATSAFALWGESFGTVLAGWKPLICSKMDSMESEESSLRNVSLVYHISEAIIVGASSRSDACLRVELLRRELRCKRYDGCGARARDLISRSYGSLGLLEPSHSAEDPLKSVYVLPVDPIWSLDKEGAAFIAGLEPRLLSGRIVQTCLSLRLRVPLCSTFLAEAQGTLALNGCQEEDLTGKPSSVRRASILELSRRACGGAIVDNSGGVLYEAILAHIYPLLFTAWRSCDHVADCPTVLSEWRSSSHVKWGRFFFFTGRLLRFVNASTLASEDDFVTFACLLRLMCASVPDAVRSHELFSPLCTALSNVESSLPNWTSSWTLSWPTHVGCPTPRTQAAFVVEQSLLRCIADTDSMHFSLFELDSLVQGLVTVTRDNDVEDEVLRLVGQLPDRVEKHAFTALPTPLSAPPGVSLWSLVVDNLAALGALGVLHELFVRTFLDASRHPSKSHRHVDMQLACRSVLLSSGFNLGGAVPFHRALRSMSNKVDIPSNDLNTTPLRTCGVLREGVLSLLRFDASHDTSRPDLLGGGRHRSILCPNGSELTVCALRGLRSDFHRDHLCSSVPALQDSSVSSLCLFVGSCASKSQQSVATGKSNCMLAISFLALGKSVPGLGYEDCPAILNARARAAKHISMVLSTDLNLEKSGLAEAVLDSCDTHRVESDKFSGNVSNAPSRSEVHNGVAWTRLGVYRLLVSWHLFKNEETMDPSKMAQTASGEWEQYFRHVYSRSCAFNQAASLRLGGTTSSEAEPFFGFTRELVDSMDACGPLGDVSTYRPNESPGFAALRGVLGRIASTLVVDSQIDALLIDLEDNAQMVEKDEEKHDRWQERQAVISSAIDAVLGRIDLGGEFYHLRDVCGDVILALREVRFGLQCCARSLKRGRAFQSKLMRVNSVLVKSLLVFPRSTSTDDQVRDGVLILGHGNCQTLLTILHALFVHGSQPQLLLSGIAVLVARWKAYIVDKEEEDRKKSSIFRLQAEIECGNSVVMPDDDSDETDFRETFHIVETDENLSTCSGKDEAPATGTEPVRLHDMSRPQETIVSKSDHLEAVDLFGFYSAVVQEGLGSRGPRECTYDDIRHLLQTSLDACGSIIGREAGSHEEHCMPLGADSGSAAFFACAMRTLRLDGVADAQGRDVPWRRDDESGYNFYSDPNPPEALRAAKALSALMSAVAVTQNTHFSDIGEHPVLQSVGVAADRAARTGSATPLSVLVTGLETVLRKADEWQRHFAQKAMRMENEVRAVAGIASYWRKLEMKSWSQLLESRALAVKKSALKWFYFLYDVLFNSHGHPNAGTRELFSSLDQFLRSSPCGEFETRVDILRNFGIHVWHFHRLSHPHGCELSRFLLGITAFYNQFVEQVRARLATTRGPLEKKMKEFASLAKWDKEGDLGMSVKLTRERDQDLEYHRLKVASERMRRKLHKLCMEMDASLRTPISEIMSSVRQEGGFSDLASTQQGAGESSVRKDNVGFLNEFVDAACLVAPSRCDVLSVPESVAEGRLGRLPDLLGRMKALSSKCFGEPDGVCADGMYTAVNLRQAIVHRVSVLRTSQHPDVQPKRKALADLLKLLKVLGVSTHPDTVPVDRRDPQFWLKTPDLGLDDGQDVPHDSQLYFGASRKLGRLLEASGGSDLNSDISRRESSVCAALSSHSFDMCGLERGALREALSLASTAKSLVEDLAELANVGQTQGTNSETGWTCHQVRTLLDSQRRLQLLVQEMKVVASMARSSIEYGRKTSENTVRDDSFARRRHFLDISLQDATKVLDILARAQQTVQGNLVPVKYPAGRAARQDSSIITSSMLAAAKRVYSSLKDMQKSVALLVLEAEKLSWDGVVSVLLRDVDAFLQQAICSADEVPLGDENLEACAPDKISKLAAAALDSSLIGAQRLRQTSELYESRMEVASSSAVYSDEWEFRPKTLAITHDLILGVSHSLNLEQVVDSLRGFEAFAALSGSRLSTEDVRTVRALSGFVGNYLNVVAVPTLQAYVRYHLACLSLCHTLISVFTGVCVDGFCRPPKDSDDGREAEENLETHDGTGFGDVGDGDASLAQNVSDQIEDEEQLLGLQSDEPSKPEEQQNRPEEPDDARNGVEMSNDFDGELEDMPDSGGEDDKNPEESDSEHQADKLMGDHRDENAEDVDEKLWDDDEPRDAAEPECSPERGEDVESGELASESTLVAREASKQEDSKQRDRKKDEPDSAGQSRSADEDQESSVSADDTADDVSNMQEGEDSKKEDGDDGEDGDESSSKRPKLKMDEASKEPDGPDADDSSGEAAEDTSEKQTDPAGEVDPTLEDSDPEGNGSDSENPVQGGNAMGEAPLDASGDTEGNEDAVGEPQCDENDDGLCPPTSELDLEDPTSDAGEKDENGNPTNVDRLPEESETRAAEIEEDDAPVSSDVEMPDEEETVPQGRGAEDDMSDIGPGATFAGEGEATTKHASHEKQPPAQSVAGVQGGSRSFSGLQHEDGDKSASNVDGEAGSDPLPLTARDTSQSNPSGSGEQYGLRPDGESDDSARNNAAEAKDSNPSRQLASEDPIEEWKKRLEILDADSEAQDGVKTDQAEGIADAGRFVNDGDETYGDAVALGAATEDQQRPLPEDDEDVSMGVEEEETKESTVKQMQTTSEPSRPGMLQKDDAGGDRRATSDEEEMSDVAEDDGVSGDNSRDLVEMIEESRGIKSSKDAGKMSAGQVVMGKDMSDDVDERLDDDKELSNLRTSTFEELSAAAGDATVIADTLSPLWQKLESLTAASAGLLCEQLRLVLEPTLASGLAGDFRSGKRLNMRRVIEFVASDYRRDRIWLRRVRPEKRTYDVLIAIDDSESMADSKAGPVALESLALLCTALARLEVGRVAVASFGTSAKLVRGFDEPLPVDAASGGSILSQFSFSQMETDVSSLLDFVGVSMCESLPSFEGEQVKLAFVVSDGRLSYRDEIRRRILHLRSLRILVAFIVIDVASSERKSIFDVQKVEYSEQNPGQMKVSPYMDDFPVDFYAVVSDVDMLPAILADSLRQWFEVLQAR